MLPHLCHVIAQFLLLLSIVAIIKDHHYFCSSCLVHCNTVWWSSLWLSEGGVLFASLLSKTIWWAGCRASCSEWGVPIVWIVSQWCLWRLWGLSNSLCCTSKALHLFLEGVVVSQWAIGIFLHQDLRAMALVQLLLSHFPSKRACSSSTLRSVRVTQHWFHPGFVVMQSSEFQLCLRCQILGLGWRKLLDVMSIL